MKIAFIMISSVLITLTSLAQDTITIDQFEATGISGLRAHWDMAIPLSESGKRIVTDSKIKDRGQTAVWNGNEPGPLSFDAVHRHLLVRFPGAAQTIADALKAGKTIDKIELVLPYADEELWPMGGPDWPKPDAYRFRKNWGNDKMYRKRRPNWHAVAWALRKPWTSKAGLAPTYNAAIPNAVYWKRFGATDTKEDRFPTRLGPAEVSSYNPAGRMDITAVLTDAAYGKSVADRLGVIANNGFIIQKWEIYDARFMQGSDAYEWTSGTGPRAIVIKNPKLVVTLKAGKTDVGVVNPVDVAALAEKHKANPIGKPTAITPTLAQVKAVHATFMAKPEWMADWQHERVKQILGLKHGGKAKLFFYQLLPGHVINHPGRRAEAQKEIKKAKKEKRPVNQDIIDYALYLAWLDWINGERPRSWQGHLTGHKTVLTWELYRDALPGPVQDSIIRSWTAWLMPDRETETDQTLRRQCDNFSGKLIHPMTDDPRVGKFKDGRKAEWNQGYTYYKKTGDWRGNKSYYRSGFTRDISTQNFNSSATAGALLMGQVIGSKYAMEDGRAGLMKFPFWMWTHNSGVGQEYVDHYYWALTFSGNKLFPDFAREAEDKMAGWSITAKGMNDLAGAYHPNLKKLLGPASRTYYQHVLGEMDGLYLLLHTVSPKGALVDLDTGKQPHLTMAKDKRGNTPRAKGAWGHDFPPALVAMQSMSGPWEDLWFGDIVDKPVPYESIVEKKVVAEGDWVTTYFGEHYGLSSIRLTGQRIHVLGHWRRKAEAPKSSTEIGTLDMRVGFNDTRIANDGAGILTRYGIYRTYQSKNRLIMLARPNVKPLSGKKLTSIQTTAALFNFEPTPTWEIYAGSTKINSLPATAKADQTITIRDGVSYIAIRPIPATDLGRDAEITFTVGNAEEPKHHNNVNIQPALLINAHFFKKAEAVSGKDVKGLENAQGGFIVEFGDAKEYGSFDKFKAHIAETKLAVNDKAVTYTTGKDTLKADWDSFTLNGSDPAGHMKTQQLWQDSSLVQMGKGRLEKNGAVIEKKADWANLLLQTVPSKNLYAASNLLPNYQHFRFTTPDGVSVTPDGRLSMCRVVVKGGKDISVKYHAFGGKYIPTKTGETPASVLFVSGTKGKPVVSLNDADVSAKLKTWTQNGTKGWLIPLSDNMPSDATITKGLNSAPGVAAK